MRAGNWGALVAKWVEYKQSAARLVAYPGT